MTAPAALADNAAARNSPSILLAFDFGLARIGVAIADTLVNSARPLATITAAASAPRFAAIDKFIREWRPARLIVGLPLSLDGGEHDMTRRCRRFGQQLHGRFGLPVDYTDERLTSVTAAALMPAGSKDKARLDARAAAVILQAWLDEHEAAAPR